MFHQESRREFFISLFEKIVFPIAGLVILGLSVRYAFWRKRRTMKEIFIGKEESIASMGMRKIEFRNEEIIVMWRDGKVVAFSLTCPHLGCRVRWKEWERRFWCPCHGAVFDENGNVLSGPSPSPLKKYEVKKKGENLYLVLNV